MTDWIADELRSARRHDERHHLVALMADRDRAADGARAEAEDARRDR